MEVVEKVDLFHDVSYNLKEVSFNECQVDLVSENFLCISDMVNSLWIVDMRNSIVHKTKMKACGLISVNPSNCVIALEGENLVQIFDLVAKCRVQSHQFPVPVKYLKWITSNILGVITSTSIYHWYIVGNTINTIDQFALTLPNDPLLIVNRNHRSEISSKSLHYEVSPCGKWSALTSQHEVQCITEIFDLQSGGCYCIENTSIGSFMMFYSELPDPDKFHRSVHSLVARSTTQMESTHTSPLQVVMKSHPFYCYIHEVITNDPHSTCSRLIVSEIQTIPPSTNSSSSIGSTGSGSMAVVVVQPIRSSLDIPIAYDVHSDAGRSPIAQLVVDEEGGIVLLLTRDGTILLYDVFSVQQLLSISLSEVSIPVSSPMDPSPQSMASTFSVRGAALHSTDRFKIILISSDGKVYWISSSSRSELADQILGRDEDAVEDDEEVCCPPSASGGVTRYPLSVELQHHLTCRVGSPFYSHCNASHEGDVAMDPSHIRPSLRASYPLILNGLPSTSMGAEWTDNPFPSNDFPFQPFHASSHPVHSTHPTTAQPFLSQAISVLNPAPIPSIMPPPSSDPFHQLSFLDNWIDSPPAQQVASSTNPFDLFQDVITSSSAASNTSNQPFHSPIKVDPHFSFDSSNDRYTDPFHQNDSKAIHEAILSDIVNRRPMELSLHLASHTETLSYRNEGGLSLLHLAAWLGFTEGVKLLLNGGSKPSEPSADGLTAWDLARTVSVKQALHTYQLLTSEGKQSLRRLPEEENLPTPSKQELRVASTSSNDSWSQWYAPFQPPPSAPPSLTHSSNAPLDHPDHVRSSSKSILMAGRSHSQGASSNSFMNSLFVPWKRANSIQEEWTSDRIESNGTGGRKSVEEDDWMNDLDAKDIEQLFGGGDHPRVEKVGKDLGDDPKDKEVEVLKSRLRLSEREMDQMRKSHAVKVKQLKDQLAELQTNYDNLVDQTNSESWKLIESQSGIIVNLEAELSHHRDVQKTQEEKTVCCVCLDRPRDILFVGCNHCCVCKECSDNLMKANQLDCPD